MMNFEAGIFWGIVQVQGDEVSSSAKRIRVKDSTGTLQEAGARAVGGQSPSAGKPRKRAIARL
jgi:hypothetical protein